MKLWQTKTGYWVGIACIGLGIILAAKLFSQGISNIEVWTKSFIRVIAPTTQKVFLSEAGTYIVFHEYQTVVDGKMFMNPEQVPGLQFSLKDNKSGKEIVIQPSKVNASYSIGSIKAKSLFEFTVASPATYTVKVRYRDGKDSPKVVLTIIQTMFKQFLTKVMMPMATAVATGLLMALAGLISIIVTFINCRKAKAAR